MAPVRPNGARKPSLDRRQAEDRRADDGRCQTDTQYGPHWCVRYVVLLWDPKPPKHARFARFVPLVGCPVYEQETTEYKDGVVSAGKREAQDYFSLPRLAPNLPSAPLSHRLQMIGLLLPKADSERTAARLLTHCLTDTGLRRAERQPIPCLHTE
ncbi:hypothetical protein CMQ_1696 [Grosmannia clavigera kw1407]|uniref:Uncharacterized protein n=1 Tax=Grosmannia clavigera (strain kw1407 / UAMH 11150) TaxID=655863 RepID=F0XFG4_GROCL|nr:uncharacterized protein CMQ_1696 [Grosmannia clavigera kw1407]EFX04768.1 hypothetical protein CMQ_1696 [Grosmannia clavigera kw1407]